MSMCTLHLLRGRRVPRFDIPQSKLLLCRPFLDLITLTLIHIPGVGLVSFSECPEHITYERFPRTAARDISSFSPWEVYPFSSSPVSVFPRQPLGKIYSHFLEAVRIRLLDDVATASAKKPNGLRQQTKRLKGGFVLSPLPTTSEWGSSWEYRTLARYLPNT